MDNPLLVVHFFILHWLTFNFSSMQSGKRLHFFMFFLLLVGLFISGYLLHHHFSLMSGKFQSSDLCNVIFSKSCNNALFSRFSNFLNVPLGGWGIIYLVILGLFLIFSRWLTGKIKSQMILSAFWIACFGVLGSMYYIAMMIIIPPLFCPFCTAFHIVNLLLFLLIKVATGKTFMQLIRGLLSGLSFLITGRQVDYTFKPIYWLAYFLPLMAGLIIFQWVNITGLKRNVQILSDYDPLRELIKFDDSEFYPIEIFAEDPVLGPGQAPVELVVFSDFQCEMCQMFATNLDSMISFNQGKLKIIYKYFPLSSECNSLLTYEGHPLACEAAYAAEAARLQGKFWEYHDSIYRYNLYDHDAGLFFRLAESMHLDMNKFKSDFESDSCRLNVKKGIDMGIALKLNGTPSVFLNGKLVRNMKTDNLNFLIRYLEH